MKLIKIYLLLAIVFFLQIPLFAQTEITKRKEFLKIKYDQTFLSISPVISPRICLGLVKSTKQSDNRFFESIYYIHAIDTFSIWKVYGIAYRGNAFISNNKRSGLYLFGNVGIDYLQYEPFFADPGGSSTSDSRLYRRLFPNIALGTGYSIRLKNDSYFRLEWDIGYKWFVSNLYLSFIW
jgi:hypothetical protein